MDRFLFSTPESLDRQAYVVATYLAEYEASADVMKAAAAVAVGQTTGSWKPVPGETRLRRARVFTNIPITGSNSTNTCSRHSERFAFLLLLTNAVSKNTS